MFTIEQIHEAYGKVRSGEDFPQFAQDLKKIGVTHYDSFVADGITNYYGTHNHILRGEPKYTSLKVNHESSSEKLKGALFIHQQGQTDYLTFCNQAAEAGVEKWTTHLIEMTVTYYDKRDNKLLVETIPNP